MASAAPALANTVIAYRTILFATNFSIASDVAASYVRSIATTYHSGIYAVHVLSESPGASEAAGWRWQFASANLRTFIDTHDLQQFPHKTLVGTGPVTEELTRFAKELAPDLIVIGTHGRTGVNKFLIGSVAEQVFRTSTCPVLTVGPHVSAMPKRSTFNTVVVATDFGESCANALFQAAAIAEQTSGRLIVLHAVDENGLAIQGWVDEVIAKAEMRVRRWATPILSKITVPWLPLARFGHPADVLLRVAAQQHADLVVMGARYSPHPSVAAHSIGATAYHVIADAGAPVLTVSEAAMEAHREGQ